MTIIRPFQEADWSAVWGILEPVFRAGDTYSFAPDISESDAHRAWVEVPTATFLAESDMSQILGTYYIKPNQPGQGAHVCNCGYMVGAAARGQGVASLMCLHSQQEAIALRFYSMQYNLWFPRTLGQYVFGRSMDSKSQGGCLKPFGIPRKGWSMLSSCTRHLKHNTSLQPPPLRGAARLNSTVMNDRSCDI